MSKVNKLYRCPICEEVLTEAEFEAQIEFGGLPYCYCQFGLDKEDNFNRIFTEYEVFVKEEEDSLPLLDDSYKTVKTLNDLPCPKCGHKLSYLGWFDGVDKKGVYYCKNCKYKAREKNEVPC